jgi:hypothetical protein
MFYQRPALKGGMYYDYYKNSPEFTFAAPYIIPFIIFFLWYIYKFYKSSPRLRRKKLVIAQSTLLKVLGILQGIGSPTIIILYGKFSNEFLRICLLIASGMFTYYCPLHVILRWCSVALNWFIIIKVEYPYMKESLMQAACFQAKLCNGGSSFD